MLNILLIFLVLFYFIFWTGENVLLTGIFVSSYIFLLPNYSFQKLLPKLIVDYGRKDPEVLKVNKAIMREQCTSPAKPLLFYSILMSHWLSSGLPSTKDRDILERVSEPSTGPVGYLRPLVWEEVKRWNCLAWRREVLGYLTHVHKCKMWGYIEDSQTFLSGEQ